MTWPEANGLKGVCEYDKILRNAAEEGWLNDLLVAHAAPCTPETARRILAFCHIPADTRIHFFNRKGQAGRSKRSGRFYISLPHEPGSMAFGFLRIGLVIHEATHILVRQRYGRWAGHDAEFQQEFRHLLTTYPWRRFMTPASDYSQIYNRHRGPFTLLLTREERKQKKGEEKILHKTDKCRGPFSAEDAHEMATTLVNDPRDNVISAFVFSETEQQFIGAFYERGQEIPSWPDVEAATVKEVVEPAPEDQPLPGVDLLDAVGKGLGAMVKKQDEAKRKVAAGPPRKKGAALVLDLGNAERWPKSQGAQIVRSFFEGLPNGEGRTAKEVVEALGDSLKAAGVEFPASLVSRLKQAGFLKEHEA